MLTLLVNLIAREDMIIFLEHPEQHLHPHAMRFLQELIKGYAASNQIVVATHESYFVEPSAPLGLRRFWWTSAGGTKVFRVEDSASNTEKQQMETVLRNLRNREIMFARSVIVVEDESQRNFLAAVAPTLGRDIDAHGVSIVYAEGESNYKPFWTILEGLGIPYVALKDKSWGDPKRYPPDYHFELGMELEDYLDEKGLASERQATIKEVGDNKRRVAGALGAKLTSGQVPPLFDEILKKAIELATGEPARS